ncbi:MAG: dehydrogenase E1 component subunit alpha/beta [Acidobacteria bacterium]|nr:dehydrogenase E1 component subunit alpha/beta [Acidobacteriota bacterium]
MKGPALTNEPAARAALAVGGRIDELSGEQFIGFYRTMLLSRRLDDRELQLKNQSLSYFQISGAGHEAVQVAAGLALRPGRDWVFPYYRDRALCLTLGLTAHDMLLNAVGAKDDPNSGGRQMPTHWSSPTLRIVSPSSACTTQCLHAVGAAEAGELLPRLVGIESDSSPPDDVVLVSLGDGQTSGGEFWESLNTACTGRLPVVYLVEDNGYAISVPVEVQTPGGDISVLIEAFPGLHVIRVDGTDGVASFRAMSEAVAWARGRSGPALVHAHVTRPYSHSMSDDERHYKSAVEREAEAARDPLRRFADFLVTAGHATQVELDAVAADVDREIQDASDRAVAAPKPDASTAALYVYSPTVDPASGAFEASAAPAPSGTPDTMVSAINRTLRDEMARDPRIVVFGEDVADASRAEILSEVTGKGGVFKATLGLQREYGRERVFNSPLAEANIVGRAIGMAVRGLKPVVEIQFFDYIWPAMMQIRDELCMLRYRSNNDWSCPVVIRVPIGGYLKGGALYHSQSGESIFAHCPGLRIAFPSTAEDAAGLLRTAIRADDPVLFLEHKHLYRQTYNKGIYPGADYTLPFARAAVRRDGADVTVLTWGALVQRSLLAAERASQEGIDVRVIDLRTIVPYDWEGIAEAVRATSRVVIAHEDQLTCGFGAELAARIADELFEHLDAPVKRLGALDCPVAYSPVLEEAILPQADDVLDTIRAIARY